MTFATEELIAIFFATIISFFCFIFFVLNILADIDEINIQEERIRYFSNRGFT